jgi:H+/Cl- antiporter ClcA
MLKLLAVTVVLAAGFIGGPIFPLFFVGGTLGVILWQIFPGIPLMMAVGCMMAAVPCAVVPFPATLAVVVLADYRHPGGECDSGIDGGA